MKLEGPELELGMELERKPELEERELFGGAGGELEGLRGGVHGVELHTEQDDLLPGLYQEEGARRE